MSIPIMAIIKESFANFKENQTSWLRLAFAPIVVYLLGIFFFMLIVFGSGMPMEAKHPPFLANVVQFIFSTLATYSLYINGYRYGILNEGGDRWWTLQLNWRLVRMFLYSLLVGVIVLAAVLVGAGIIFGSHMAFASVSVDVFFGTLIALFLFYALFRLVLLMPLIAIDNDKPMSVAWGLMKGNVLRWLGLALLLWLILVLIFIGASIIGGLIGGLFYLVSPFLLVIPVIIGLIFMLYFFLLSWAVFTKALSLVYLSLSKGNA